MSSKLDNTNEKQERFLKSHTMLTQESKTVYQEDCDIALRELETSTFLSQSEQMCDWPNRVASIKYPWSPFTTVYLLNLFFAKNSSNPLELFVLIVRLLFDPFRSTIQCQINVQVRFKKTHGCVYLALDSDQSRRHCVLMVFSEWKLLSRPHY